MTGPEEPQNRGSAQKRRGGGKAPTGRSQTPRVQMPRPGRKESIETVVQLFGKAPLKEDPPLDPDGIRPVSPEGGTNNRKGKRRVSIGAKMADVMMRIEDGSITMREFVSVLSQEELVKGQLRAHDGTFKGRPPKWVPAEFYQECIRELLRRGEETWRGAYLDSIQVFAKIAQDVNADPKDRLKAAQYVIERVAGKTPDRVEVAVAQPWETIISGIVAEAEDDAIARATRVLGESG